MMHKLRKIMADPVGEATPCHLRVLDVQVPDATVPVTGLRFATAPEMATAELTVTDHLGAVINAKDAVTLLPAYGAYNATTGVLVVALVAADNPIVSTTLSPGFGERHLVFVHLPDLLWVEIFITVQNTGLVPNPP